MPSALRAWTAWLSVVFRSSCISVFSVRLIASLKMRFLGGQSDGGSVSIPSATMMFVVC